jgi:hypothetical protein
LVEFYDVKKIEPPLAFDHQENMDDWLKIVSPALIER